MWDVAEADLEAIAVGAGILGTGGGGSPHRGKLLVRRHLREGARIVVVSPRELPDDALGVNVAGIGAPLIGIERIQRGDEAYMALRALEQKLGRPITHIVPVEIGGSNSALPLVVGAQSGLPVVDVDGMGRAFPELQMTSFFIEGAPASPATLCDYRHSIVTFENLPDARALERAARAVTVAFGGSAAVASTPLTGSAIKRTGIHGTLSFAKRLGDAIHTARREHTDPIAAACAVSGGMRLFHGKVTDVQRRLVAGFARGELIIDGLAEWRGASMRVAFQNENLIAWQGDEVVATAPDLICIVDELSAEPVTTEVMRYGLRVVVLGIPAPAVLKS
ncbi:MAG: DUF917 domain-containing protein, partial [Dehalococcoidia bacterium]